MKKVFLASALMSIFISGCATQSPGTINSTVQSWPKVFEFRGFSFREWEDGSGSFGKNVTKRTNINANDWTYSHSTDPITDGKNINVSRSGLATSYKIPGSGIFLILNYADNERLCVSGDEDPTTSSVIRVGTNDAIFTDDDGCMRLTDEIDEQLRSGDTAIVRAADWPTGYKVDSTVDLNGYSEVTDFLRLKR